MSSRIRFSMEATMSTSLFACTRHLFTAAACLLLLRAPAGAQPGQPAFCDSAGGKGCWGSIDSTATDIPPVHAVLLPNGKVFTYGIAPDYVYQLYDPATNTIGPKTSQNSNPTYVRN